METNSVESNILENLNANINFSISEKEKLYNIYKIYIENIIISVENVLYKQFSELKLLQNLNTDHSEDTIYELIKLYLPTYMNNLETGDFNILDKKYIEDIKSICHKNNKEIKIIVENIINLTYPFIDRNILNIDVIASYISGIKEQLNEIFDINKIDIIKLI